jgi:hypothetical protein
VYQPRWSRKLTSATRVKKFDQDFERDFFNPRSQRKLPITCAAMMPINTIITSARDGSHVDAYVDEAKTYASNDHYDKEFKKLTAAATPKSRE